MFLFLKKISDISCITKREFYFIFGSIFILKLVTVILVSVLYDGDSISLYTPFADDNQYIGYAENLFNTKEYFYDFGKEGYKDFTFRMPGITFIYYPLRFFFDMNGSILGVVFFQLLFSSIALIKVLKLINKYVVINNVQYLLVVIFCLYSSYLESSLMTESLAVSSLVFTFYHLNDYLDKEHKISLLYSGFFTTWMIFLRPFMIPLLILIPFFLIYKKRKFKIVFFYLIPFIIFDGIWISRNYFNQNKIVVLDSSMTWIENKNESLTAKINFIKSFGFKWVNFEEDSQNTWFNNKTEAPSVKIPSNSIFPSRTFKSGMTIDSLLLARELMHKTVDVNLDLNERIYSDKEAARILNKFVAILKKESPFDYYIGNRIRLVYSFLKPNTPRLFSHGPYPLNVVVSNMHVILSVFIKMFGYIGLFLFFLKNYNKIEELFFFCLIPAFVLFLFPIYLKTDETRFFYMAFPFLVFGAIYFNSLIFNFLSKSVMKNK